MSLKFRLLLLVLFSLVPSVAITNSRPAEAIFQTPLVGSITGRVVDAAGKPAFQTEIRILPADRVFSDHDAVFAEDRRYVYVDQSGAYTFQGVQPGRYVIAVNADFRHEYPPTYYPGVQDISQAEIITVGENDKLMNVDVALPLPSLTRWKLDGAVVWLNGQPAGRARVGLSMAKYPWIMPYSLDADDQGRFSLYGYTEYEYYAQAYGRTSDGADTHAEPPLVSANQTTGPIKLILSSSGRLCTHIRPKQEPK